MKARYGDKEVCPKCNGTGVELFYTGKGRMSRVCVFAGFESRGQMTLTPEPRAARARTVAKRRKTGNRWHTKN